MYCICMLINSEKGININSKKLKIPAIPLLSTPYPDGHLLSSLSPS